MKAFLPLLLTGLVQYGLALDLTPKYTVINADGLETTVLQFRDDLHIVQVYVASEDWKATGASNYVTFKHKEWKDAVVSIVKSSKRAYPGDNDDACKSLAAAIKASAPQGATKVEIVEESKMPFALWGWKTHLVSIKWTEGVEDFQKSVIVAALPSGDEIQISATASTPNFGKASGVMREIMHTWSSAPTRKPSPQSKQVDPDTGGAGLEKRAGDPDR